MEAKIRQERKGKYRYIEDTKEKKSGKIKERQNERKKEEDGKITKREGGEEYYSEKE